MGAKKSLNGTSKVNRRIHGRTNQFIESNGPEGQFFEKLVWLYSTLLYYTLFYEYSRVERSREEESRVEYNRAEPSRVEYSRAQSIFFKYL